MLSIWHWLKANDLPNWIALTISSLVGPFLVLWWDRRTVQSVTGLEVARSPGNVEIVSGAVRNAHPTVTLDFINHTGSVAYITDASVKVNSSAVRVPTDASLDTGRGTHHIAFMDPNGQFTIRELTLQPKERGRAGIVLTSPMPEAFYAYIAPWYRRWLGRPKYFKLYYAAMVGKDRYTIAMVC
jgi:hypothetical protein